MIRRPGFTTPAELLLVVATVDAMYHHVDGLNQSGAALMKGVSDREILMTALVREFLDSSLRRSASRFCG